MMDEEIRQAVSEVREMKQMCGNINMKLTNIVTQRGQNWKAKLEAEYQRGFEDGKAQAECGCEGCKHEGSSRALAPCYYCTRNSTDYWTAKQTDDEIKVGDEVYCKGDDTSDSGVVTWVGKKRVCTMWQDGSAGEVEKDELIKTNRHFDIASILKELQND